MRTAKSVTHTLALNHHRLKHKLDTIEIDAHWFRRVFHTFAASFLLYYLLPDQHWITTLKYTIAIVLVITVTFLEYLRIKGHFNLANFFGLRTYEVTRPAGYLYFGVALLLLLLFFPQQIAIPCILCACFTDPIMGETRTHLGNTPAILIGFLISAPFFLITWYPMEPWILLMVTITGATGAILGETSKLRFLDDDFLIQILPALLLVFIWQGFQVFGISILPPEILIPI